MTADQVRELLHRKVKEFGSQAALAKQLNISAPYLHDVLKGAREPAGAVCDALGLERVVTYVRK
jgi:DNA-binding transcriptional regulator YdaS (Cro superfamily)